MEDVKTGQPVLDPNQPALDGVKPPADVSKPLDVKPDGSPAQDVNLAPQPDPGEKTDPALLLKSLQEERDRRRAAEARETQIKNLYGDKMQFDMNGNPIAPPQQEPQTDMQQKLNELWESDPRKAVQTEMMMGFQWYDKVNTALDVQRAQVRAKYPDFTKYENQALNYVRTLPLNQRAREGVIELAYLVQKGQDSGSIYEQAQRDLLEKMKRGESIQGFTGTQSQASQPTGKQPTDAEVKAAEAMGVPITEYVKYRR